MGRLFGTDGVRGIANADLSPELAFRLGEAAGRILAKQGGRIVIGRDTRRSGDMLEAALVAGIGAAGADALLAGIVPTPAVAFLTRELGADAGAVISASHNPAEYNGIKFFDRDGFKLADDVEGAIEAFVAGSDHPERPTGAEVGIVSRLEDAVARYVRHAVATAPERLEGLRIVLDCGHGAGSTTSALALRELGADVDEIDCDWNGTDINLGCGSTHLEVLAQAVRSTGADLGIAHDGDADRTLAVDESGAEVDGDEIMAICARMMHEAGTLTGDVVVGTVMTNLGFIVAMREMGVDVRTTAVGDRYVLEEMRRSGAALGGEQSGHIIFLQHTTTGDGLITAIQLLGAVRSSGRPLSELKRVMRRFPQVLENVRVSDLSGLPGNTAIAGAIEAEEAALGERGRVLVRASGTEPVVRVMAEASESQTAQAVVARLVQVVHAQLG